MPLNGKTSRTNCNTLSGESHTHLIPYDEDPLVRLAQLLLDREREHLPDLSRAIVLFPDSGTNQRFRHALLAEAGHRGITALIPPDSGNLRGWVMSQKKDKRRVLGQTDRELLLLSALSDFPELTVRYGAWPLVDSLLALFDELGLNFYTLPPDPNLFIKEIEDAYGVQALGPLSTEARLVHDLWLAWQRHLQETDADDETTAYLAALSHSAKHLDPEKHVYLAGFLQFHRAEIRWISSLRNNGRIDLLFHGNGDHDGHHPSSAMHNLLHDLKIDSTPIEAKQPYGRMLDAVFETGGQSLKERAAKQSLDISDSPAKDRLEICIADNPEEEARAIDIQVRQWLLDGTTNIGIVTNDRRLARRIRALLERANISLMDSAGWTLSTTSAASAVIHWIDCVEHSFQFSKLLDCLKSPFLTSFVDRHGGPDRISQFEETIVYRFRIASDVQRYLTAIDEHTDDLDSSYGEGSAAAIKEMLESVQRATQPLNALLSSVSVHTEQYIDAVTTLLTELGLDQSLLNDAAGAEIMSELQELKVCSRHSEWHSNWQSFRTWLMRHLERCMFKPPLSGNGVELMGFAESRLYKFQAVIVAGVSREHLPGGVHDTPFFNQGVRQQLGLPSLYLAQRTRLADFRRLLEAAPRVLITACREKDDKPVILSPWLERLQAFHELAYGHRLDAPILRQLAKDPRTMIHRDPAELPETENAPTTTVPRALLPQQLSATGYQKLIDCPFSFFANYCLGLKPLEEISAEMEKSDYGSLVHRTLQLFHSGSPATPGGEILADAQTRLTEISEAVFSPQIKRQPSARGWFYLWLRTIPAYLAWQEKRARSWQVSETELKCETQLIQSPPLALVGRLDRVDTHDGNHAIIDYKTGKAPTQAEIESGESVQLPFYALLMDNNIEEVCALELGDASTRVRAVTGDETLAPLVQAHQTRLVQVFEALGENSHVSAWGDPATCRRCDYGNVCRKDLWEQDYDAE
jgi:ATP-dependent helicase/nuclease subunit B